MEMIQTRKIFPPHGVRDREKLATMVASMEAEGWCGRPLLVIESGDGYRAITGSHRYAAAEAVGILEIPCVEVDIEAFYANHDTSDLLDDEITLSILRDIGDEAAARLMWEEVACN